MCVVLVGVCFLDEDWSHTSFLVISTLLVGSLLNLELKHFIGLASQLTLEFPENWD